MNIIVLTIIIMMLLGAPNGLIVSLAVALIAAAVRTQGRLRERALGMLKTPFLWTSVAFSLAALLLEDGQGVAIVWLIVAFTISAWWGRGTVTDRDRAALIVRFVAALTGLTMAWVTWDWVTRPTVVWLLAVALVAVGVFGMVLRCMALPWFADTFSRVRTVGLAGSVAMCTAIIAVPFV